MVRKLSIAEKKLQMRKEAKRKVPGSKYSVRGSRDYREQVEQGRQDLLKRAAIGGDPRASKLKSELEYLLNNYTPSNDSRIHDLIDQWRKAPGSDYNPEIKARFRRVKREYGNKSNAF